jgi:metal-responsive CopG/Arc/MetJ family transcriptional regulator
MVNMTNKIKGLDNTVRSSISFSHKIYDSIEKIAISKKVSIAWVVRDAVETYLERQTKGYIVEQDAKNV